MVSLCIKTNNSNVLQYLSNNIASINLDQIVFVQKKFSNFQNFIIHYLGNEIPTFYSELCSIITNCIIEIYEPTIVSKLLLFNYFYFDDTDLRTISSNCLKALNEDKTNINDRKNYLWADVLRYISFNKSIYLKGFITFRINDYIKSIEDVVDFCVSQFVINREYNEFIDMLKAYIDCKPPIVDLVHIIYLNEQSILLDKDYHVISLSKKNLDMCYLSDISFSSNDYALNSLLSLLPNKIVVHLITPSDDFINTLQLIFTNRVSICTDCNICKTYKSLNKEHGS